MMKNDLRQMVGRAVYYGFLLLSVTIFMSLYSQLTWEYPPANLAALINGSATKPFVLRALVPTVIRLVSAWWNLPAEHVAGAINWACTLWILGLFRFWISRIWQNDKGLQDWGPLALLYAFAANFFLCSRMPYRYPYDLPGVAFFLSGIVAFREGFVLLGLSVFAIGVLNRESILFLLPVYIFLRFDREKLPVILVNTFAMGCWWILSRMAMLHIFRENQGGLVEFKLISNFYLLAGMHGDVFDRISIMGCCGFLWVYAILDWWGLPQEIRRLFVVWAPFLLVNLFFANIHELRVYNEMAPITVMGALHLFQKIQKFREAPWTPTKKE